MNRFEEIYAKERWGKGLGSGKGSDPSYCEVYLRYVRGLMNSDEYESVLDVGCGDWQVGSMIYWREARYLGLDVVEPVVAEVYEKYKTDFIKFRALDCSTPGVISRVFERRWDLVLIKDVLQHWSDEEIAPFAQELASLPWKTLIVVNDWRFVREREKNGRPRSVDNQYSWAALPCDHPTLAPLGLSPVAYYPSNRRKQIARADR